MNESEDDPTSFLQKPWVILASGFTIGVVVLLAVWLIFSDTPQEQTSKAASSVESAESPDPSDDEQVVDGVDDELEVVGSDGCDIEESTDTEFPTEGPEVEWKIVNTMAIPLSEVHGPFIFTDTKSECYSRSPQSALIAAVHASKWVVSEDRRQAWLSLTAPGEGQDRGVALHDEEEATGEIRDPSSAAPGSFCQTAAFSFIDFTPDKAIIDLVLRCPEGGYASGITTMIWDQDRQTWLAVLQPDATRSATVKSVDSLEGYVLWGAT